PRTGTPIRGLTLTLAGAALLLLANQIALALNIAVFALVILYFLHSLTFLLLPRRNPSLFASITINIPASLQRAAVWTSLPAMGGLIALQVWQDVQTLFRLSLRQRLADHALTSLELVLVWGAVGVALYAMGSRRGQRAATEKQIVFDQPLP
ncbi:MAG TPA: hypothetical protein PLD20_34225, partial [Blastocatellia bacterium]|nr:hypothetical protein [Blastocatellia bacterium]